jgi:hypothetical protein
MTKKKTAALLDNPGSKKLSHIEIETNTGSKITMIFTNRTMAQQELQRIRAQGIISGEWVKEIQFWESDENTFLTP